MRNNVFLGILMMFFIVTCTAPFDYEVREVEEFLVVDASFTSERKAHRVIISYTFPLNRRTQRFAGGATVWIEDLDGGRIDFEERERGIYETAPDVAGEIGHRYILHINIGGLDLVSSEEIMLDPVPIDSIYGRYIGLPFDDGSFKYGIQFLVDSRGDENLARNYRYEYEETHEISLPFGSRFFFDKDEGIATLRETFLTNCYATDLSSELLIATSSGLSDNSILEFPLSFISESSEKLKVRYSLIVRQFAVSAAAYQFYREVKKTNESSGSFFDEQKGLVSGNIEVVGDPTTPVLGYFEVAGVGESRRVFAPRDFADQGFKPDVTDNCQFAIDTMFESALIFYFDTFPNNNLVFLDGVPPNRTAIAGSSSCTDCTNFGDLTKPDFWP